MQPFGRRAFLGSLALPGVLGLPRFGLAEVEELRFTATDFNSYVTRRAAAHEAAGPSVGQRGKGALTAAPATSRRRRRRRRSR